MSAVTDLARWLDTDFADLNTELEEAYFTARAEIVYEVADLDQRKHALRDDGATLIGRLGESTDVSYELLGTVGLYLKLFLEEPAASAPPDRLARLTASGPLVDVVLAVLSRLVDLRVARDRPGTAHARLARLRAEPVATR